MKDALVYEQQLAENRSVAIVVNTYDQAHFLAESLQSCIRQTVKPSEILLVDDGSHDKPEVIARRLSDIRIYRQENAGLSAARNAGLARISSEFIIFLDADDRLTPVAIEAGLECFDKNPDAWMVYGAYRVIDMAGRTASVACHQGLGVRPFLELLRRGNAIAMHAAVMYRTDCLRSIVGFDENLQACEDFDVYLRIARVGHIATHDRCVAEYRHHEHNLSRDKRMMLEVACSVVRMRAAEDHSREAHVAGQRGQRLLTRQYAPEIFFAGAKSFIRKRWSSDAAATMFRAARMAPLALLKGLVLRGVKAIIRRLPRSIGQIFGEALWVPPVGNVRFGDFKRTKPVSTEYGFDRGKPVDRYFIERALADYAELVRGRVLEVGASDYTRLFGAEKTVSSDVLDIDPSNRVATIVGDLGIVGSLPEGAFDCIVLTQTLQLIYNLNNAMDNLYRALAPGGALLITVPGISPIGRDEIKCWYWSFTQLSLKRLLSGRFGESNVQVGSYGNVFAAICFLTGLSLAEVGTESLEYKDESYPVTVFACARKLR